MKKPPPPKQTLEAIVPAVILPDGYRGKILLVSIVLGRSTMTALRSGDLWHRDILRNTRTEMVRIGLADARVEQRGGAHLRFEEDGAIRIWGRSEEFGACDLDHAAALVRAARPGNRVVVSAREWA